VRPVLFEWRGIRVHAYPFFLFVGLTFGILAGTRAGAMRGLDPVRLYVALLILVIPALVGSRVLYALSHWQLFRDNPARIFSTQTGGAALYGGLLLALGCSWPVLRVLRLPLGGFWDAATITILVGMTFTKIGCLMNGCCAGRETSGWLALRLPNTRGVWRRRVPTQLIECALAAVLLWGALEWRADPFDGELFLSAVALYGTARLALEPTRETVDRIAGVSVYRAISLLLVAGAVGSLALVWWGPR
jgi:phosphatidylglycerol:prolipoprotein diacylglycerol transferase